MNPYARTVTLLCLLSLAGCGGSSTETLPVVSPEPPPQTKLPVEKVDIPSSDSQGIGVERDVVIRALSEKFDATFRDASRETPAEHLYQSTIHGVPVKLWGDPSDLEAITIIGAFDGGAAVATAAILNEVLGVATPAWPEQERADWFQKAAASDASLDVSTLQGDVTVKVVSMNLGEFTIRTISFTRQ